MIDPRILAFSVESPDGFITRWGGDEPDANDVPSGINFTTKMPGGFNTLNTILPRPISQSFSDLTRFSPFKCYGQGNLTAFEGYLADTPRSHGTDFSATPGVVGWAASLRDDPSFRQIYRDIDLSRWAGPSVQRQLNLTAAGVDVDGPSVVQDVTNGAPSLRVGFTGAWARRHDCNGTYNASGIAIGSLYYAWKKNGEISAADTAWSWTAYLSTDDSGYATTNASGNLRAAGPGSGTLTASGAAKYHVLLELSYNAAAGAAGANYDIFWTTLAVYGNHGLTKRGTEPNAGFYASDVIPNIITAAAPSLNYTTGANGSIQPTSFVIPHLIFPELTTAEDAITGANRFDLYDWAVYEGKTFQYRPQASGRVWNLRVGDGVRVEEEGPQIETSFNGVVVEYTDAAGTQKFVGPTGFTGGTASTALTDTSSSNPLNAFGRRKWARISMGVSTESGAIQVGSIFLAEISARKTRGSVVVTGTARDSNGVVWPAWYMRAGDSVVLEDTNDTAARVIVDTSYAHETLELTANLDAPANKLDALLERLQISLSPLGIF